jgi:predicted dehydrogenase
MSASADSTKPPEAIPVAVVGVGHLGRHHARLYASLPAARLVGVVDRDRERAREVAREFGCEAWCEPGKLPGRVRAASVAVPTVDHRTVAETLLRGGIDVLVEKPMAATLEDADAINDAARQADRLVMVGHTERFNPALVALARAVREPRFFEIHRLAAFTARSTDIDVLLDLMVHDLDLVLHLDRSEAVSVDAVGVAALTDKVDIANARVRMTSGCVANLTASRISVERVRRVRVFQPRTYLACDTARREVERYRLVRGSDGAPAIEHDRLPVEDREPLAEELKAFLRAVRDRVTPAVDGRHGRRVLELALRVRKAIDDSRIGP